MIFAFKTDIKAPEKSIQFFIKMTFIQAFKPPPPPFDNMDKKKNPAPWSFVENCPKTRSNNKGLLVNTNIDQIYLKVTAYFIYWCFELFAKKSTHKISQSK